MANYASAAQVGARLGYSITSSSRPNLTQIASYLQDADSIINAFMFQSANVTDTYGLLRVVAINLVCKMTNNLFSMAEPENFAYMEIMLNEEEKEMVRKSHRIWSAYSWKMGS